MPAEGTDLPENLSFDLAREASELSAQRIPVARLAVAELVRWPRTSLPIRIAGICRSRHGHILNCSG